MCSYYTKNFGVGKNYQIWRIAYALTVAYSLNFSSPIAFTCMVRQKFFLPKFSHVRCIVVVVVVVIVVCQQACLHATMFTMLLFVFIQLGVITTQSGRTQKLTELSSKLLE